MLRVVAGALKLLNARSKREKKKQGTREGEERKKEDNDPFRDPSSESGKRIAQEKRSSPFSLQPRFDPYLFFSPIKCADFLRQNAATSQGKEEGETRWRKTERGKQRTLRRSRRRNGKKEKNDAHERKKVV